LRPDAVEFSHRKLQCPVSFFDIGVHIWRPLCSLK
jgi:hypothetical protein